MNHEQLLASLSNVLMAFRASRTSLNQLVFAIEAVCANDPGIHGIRTLEKIGSELEMINALILQEGSRKKLADFPEIDALLQQLDAQIEASRQASFKETIRTGLRDATLLVSRAWSGDLTLKELRDRYENFYYEYALDGHEADEVQLLVLKELSDPIRFHDKVQTEVLNLVCFEEGEKLDAYLKAGRISEQDALQRLKQLAHEYDISGLIDDLRRPPPNGDEQEAV